MEPQYNIFVIDQVPQALETIENKLPANEFDIMPAQNIGDVKEQLKKGQPDLIFLGADIKEFNPLVLCKKFSVAGVGVILISGSLTREIIIEAAKHGAIDVLLRPLEPNVILQKTEKALVKMGKMALPQERELKVDFRNASGPREKVEILVKQIKELLALPFAVVKIIRLCNDPSASAKDLEKPVRSDPAIAAMIMRRATSAAYAGVGQTTSIQRAVVRIGMKATRNIASSFSVFKLFSEKENSFGFNRIWFWVHSLATGICAQMLATLLKYRQPDDAFIAGLLHDIGKMVLDDFLNQEFHQAIQAANKDGIPVRAAEKSVFQTTHTYVGSRVAKFWGFPPVIAEAIARHHRYDRFTADLGSVNLDAVVCMADQMAKGLLAGSGGDFLAERDALTLWQRFPKGLPWRKIIRKIFEEIEEYTEVLEIPPDQFQIELPEEDLGSAGIFVPRSPNYGHLLQICLERLGLKTTVFTPEEVDKARGEGLNLVVGDLSLIDDEEEAARHYKLLNDLAASSIIIPATDSKKRPFNLDFFWLESRVKKALDKG